MVLGFIFIRECWNARKGSFNHFLWVGFLILILSQWIDSQPLLGNLILLFPVLILVLATFTKRWKEKGTWISIGILSGLLILPWIIFAITIKQINQFGQNPLMFIMIPFITLVCLYWIKWWAILPSQDNWEANF